MAAHQGHRIELSLILNLGWKEISMKGVERMVAFMSWSKLRGNWSDKA